MPMPFAVIDSLEVGCKLEGDGLLAIAREQSHTEVTVVWTGMRVEYNTYEKARGQGTGNREDKQAVSRWGRTVTSQSFCL